MDRDKSIRPKKDNKKEEIVGEKWDITWEGQRGLVEKLKWCVIKPKNSKFPSFCQLFTPHTLTYWPSHFQDSLYLTWLALPTTHIFRFFSPTWDYLPSISQDMFLDLISLSLFLRLGVQLHFTASMPVLLFTTS